MEEAFIGWLIVWLILSIIVGAIGSGRNVGFWEGFLASFLLTPVIGLVIVLASKDKENEKYKKEILKTQKEILELVKKETNQKSKHEQLLELSKMKDDNLTMESFASKTGVITKFTDTNFDYLKALHTVAETRIRKINSGNTESYFYQIKIKGKYSNSTASIGYSDLLEIIKVLNTLKSRVDNDIAANPYYINNQFITDDGFEVGCYISKGKVAWYVKLERYGSEKTLFIKDVSTLINAFNNAKNKIGELKKT